MTATALANDIVADINNDINNDIDADVAASRDLLAELTARLEAVAETDPDFLSTTTPAGRALAHLAAQAREHAAVLGRPQTASVTRASGVVVVRDAVAAGRELARALGC